jgi:ABC-type sugar transport system permease subunit
MPVDEHMPEMERLQDNPSLPELSSQQVTIMTTEHYNLQMGRAMTVADANGRSTLYIGAVSGALIAIAFTGQVSRMGTAFFVFSLVLLPSLFLMGLITFERVLQSGIEDLTYARGIMRIRRLYLEYAPQLRPSFMLAADDDSRRPTLKVGLHPSWWQVFLTTAGMIAAINSVLLGVFVGLLLAALFSFPLLGCTSAGVLTFLLSLGIQQRYQWGQWSRLEQDLAALVAGRRTE